MDSFAKRAEQAMRQGGRRITPLRRALLAVLDIGGREMAPRDLHRELGRRGIQADRVSVYRNLATLLSLGLVHRVVGSRAVRACATSGAGAMGAATQPARGGRPRRSTAPRCHHAIVCSGCGSAREFHSAALERALSEVRKSTRWRVEGHVLELRGLCQGCQGK